MNVRLAITLVAIGSAVVAAPSQWQGSLTKNPAGSFSEPRPLRAIYHFGWSGLTAATGEAKCSRVSPDRFQIDAAGRTIGSSCRALWRYDVTYKAIDNAHNLMPVETESG